MSRIWGTKMVQQHTIIEQTCDGCGKVVRDNPDEWYEFYSSHNDWGGDSLESRREHDSCSGVCYLKIVKAIVNDYGTRPNPTLLVDGKSYEFLKTMVS